MDWGVKYIIGFTQNWRHVRTLLLHYAKWNNSMQMFYDLTLSHHLLNVILQIANKLGLLKKKLFYEKLNLSTDSDTHLRGEK
jgi:hypothetical protein